MKLTIVLLTVALLDVSANGLSQTISFTGKNVPLEKVFSAIEHQTNYTFFYKSGLLEKASLVSVDLKGAPLTRALDLCFQNQPFTYSLNGRIITIEMRRPETIPAGQTGAGEAGLPLRNIIGIVNDESGSPMAGVTVIVKGSRRGTQTDAKGIFILKNLNDNDVLVVSAIGYGDLSIPLAGRDGFLNLIMQTATNNLDKVIIQAYGITSQRLTTGNIARVSAEEIEKQPVMNPLLALQGRVAGLVITPTSGYASGIIKAEIRGRNTINPGFSSDPLYIIDGVPLTVMEVGGLSSYQGGSPGFIQNGLPPSPAGGQSPLFSLNPADIESIEVLKDADATSIYGSRGANGVILITTKKGKSGKTRFNLNVTQGMSEVTRHWSMMNTSQYLQMRREAFKNDGITPTAGTAPDLLLWDTTRSTDWQKQLWGGKGQVTDVQTALSGGDARTVFRISAGYQRQTQILAKSGDDQKVAISFNLNHHTLDQKLSVSLTTDYSYARVNTIITPSAVTLAPDAPSVYDDKGNLNYAPWDAAGIGYQYPFSPLLVPYVAQTNFLTSNLTTGYELFRGLSFRVSLGYNNGQANNSLLIPIASADPVNNPTGQAMFGANRNSNWIIEPQLSYTGVIGEGKLTVLAGGSKQSTETDGSSQWGIGYTNDAFIRSIANAPIVVDGEGYGQYKYAAVFGRINYDWGNKYILNLNARRDGSSRFGPGRQFGNFGSVGAAWIATEEGWLRRALPSFISFIKLRGSYGLTGSDAVGDYQYLSQWSASPTGTPLPQYGGVTPLLNLHAVDQDYHWQVNKKLEGALDLGFGKDNRFNFEAAWYRNRCDNQLLQYPTPVFSGFPFVTANWPANVQNSGLEFLFNGKLVSTKDFSWSINFNIAINRNKLLAYPNIENSPYNTLKVGQSLNDVYLLHYTGVDAQTGQYTYSDFNKDGTVSVIYGAPPGTGIDDRYVTIDLSPKFTGGLGNQFNYRSCSLSFFLSFKKQMAMNALYSGAVPGNLVNQSLTIFNNRWQQPGDKAEFARFTTIGNLSDYNFQSSDQAYTNASYIRLSNLAFSYSVPAKAVQKAHMQGCNLFVRAENILVITKYKGIDPETQSFGSLPPAKVFTGGISFNF